MISTCVRMTVEWLIPAGQTRAITTALHSMAEDARSVQSCITCSVSSDARSRGLVRYVEEWDSEDDLRHRVQSPAFRHLLTLMEDSAQPPRVEFTLGQSTRGREFLRELRSQSRR